MNKRYISTSETRVDPAIDLRGWGGGRGPWTLSTRGQGVENHCKVLNKSF